MSSLVETVAAWVNAATSIVALTGAGISTESGIPDFRGPGGTWTRYQPVTIQEFLANPLARAEYWRRQHESYPVMSQARPNVAHLALAELERLERLDCVITQNVDG